MPWRGGGRYPRMVKKSLTLSVRQPASLRCYPADMESMREPLPPYVADRAMLADATDLIACFGDEAAREAAARADHSRDVGNVVRFCRWRQVERLVLLLNQEVAPGTIH